MTSRILIIGGYGNFGSYISKTLAQENNITVIIAGRSIEKAQRFIKTIEAANTPEAAALDITKNLEKALQTIKPDIVIHTSGPFQGQSYDVAGSCINARAHYIDLADARDFVAGITALDKLAKDKGVLVISGVSSVPCLTSALVDYYLPQFETLESLDYGITTAQKTNRGLATTAAILGYCGRPFKTLIDGQQKDVYGWQSLHTRKYNSLGRRLLGNCDVPDLELFPERYPTLKNIRFYAGLEIPFIHLGLWVLSGLVRIGLIRNLPAFAPFLLKASFLFDWAGSDVSGFHMELSGKDDRGADKAITFELTARSGHGPYIPCMPAILMAKKLASGEITMTGATPCISLITRDEYLDALKELDIEHTELSS
ncbi:MAG: saccharopine dehydrogenase NADP-binding domain-containing protein [Alphaproteobacteria bacterium]